jgi:hypothetical protein
MLCKLTYAPVQIRRSLEDVYGEVILTVLLFCE